MDILSPGLANLNFSADRSQAKLVEPPTQVTGGGGGEGPLWVHKGRGGWAAEEASHPPGLGRGEGRSGRGNKGSGEGAARGAAGQVGGQVGAASARRESRAPSPKLHLLW